MKISQTENSRKFIWKKENVSTRMTRDFEHGNFIIIIIINVQNFVTSYSFAFPHGCIEKDKRENIGELPGIFIRSLQLNECMKSNYTYKSDSPGIALNIIKYL